MKKTYLLIIVISIASLPCYGKGTKGGGGGGQPKPKPAFDQQAIAKIIKDDPSIGCKLRCDAATCWNPGYSTAFNRGDTFQDVTSGADFPDCKAVAQHWGAVVN